MVLVSYKCLTPSQPVRLSQGEDRVESNAFPSRSWLQKIHRHYHHKVDESGRTLHKERNILTKALQETVEKASHWIWVKREDTS